MNGQIFIGMIALNFQPKTDILTLIEQLDHACIRFVHFSEDQVLRSKVCSNFISNNPSLSLFLSSHLHVTLCRELNTELKYFIL